MMAITSLTPGEEQSNNYMCEKRLLIPRPHKDLSLQEILELTPEIKLVLQLGC